jgi:sulfite exporter TauE/SafE
VAIIGFSTSFHCLGMCGGISLSLCTSGERRADASALLSYHGSRVLTCAIIGAVAGLLGEAFSVNMYIKMLIPLLCGIGMFLAGLRQLGVLRGGTLLGTKFRFPKIPDTKWMPRAVTIGFLNAFMPCGSLQSMEMYAMSSANVLQGMLIMLVFSLSTVPVLLAFGLFSSGLTSINRQLLSRIAGVLVLILAVRLIYNGISMAQMM